MNVEDPRSIRVIRPPARSTIDLVLREFAEVNRNIPADLQGLLDRLHGEDRCPNLEIVTCQDGTG